MPVVQISVPEGALTPDQKRQVIERVTDVLVDVEGLGRIRPSVHVLISEVADGGYGVGGRAWTLEALTAAFGGAKAEPGA